MKRLKTDEDKVPKPFNVQESTNDICMNEAASGPALPSPEAAGGPALLSSIE